MSLFYCISCNNNITINPLTITPFSLNNKHSSKQLQEEAIDIKKRESFILLARYFQTKRYDKDLIKLSKQVIYLLSIRLLSSKSCSNECLEALLRPFCGLECCASIAIALLPSSPVENASPAAENASIDPFRRPPLR